MKAWARRRVTAHIDQRTVVRLRSLDPLTLVAALVLRPDILRHRFEVWTTLPGDRWTCFARMVDGIVVKPLPGGKAVMDVIPERPAWPDCSRREVVDLHGWERDRLPSDAPVRKPNTVGGRRAPSAG